MAVRMRTVFLVGEKVGLPVALVAAIAGAGGAVVLLRPPHLRPPPRPLDPRAYFSPAQLEKAEAFRTGQLWLYGAQLVIEGALLVALVRRPPQRLRRAGTRRPVLAAAATA